ncbi:hypothetical protein M3Y98_00408000 [Aphelenchoides besseyi]|nr:hypothetical protein M3Y98_00408000 [Aphelenchoides besseyi]
MNHCKKKFNFFRSPMSVRPNAPPPPLNVDHLTNQLDYLHVSTNAPLHEITSTVNDITHRSSAHQQSWSSEQIANGASRRANGPLNAQPLLQLVPPVDVNGSQLPASSSLATAGPILSPHSPQTAAAYYYQQHRYYAPPQFATTASAPYPPYQPYHQWPMTNINFMPNLFVMTNAGQTHSFPIPPPTGLPPPLMKTPFRSFESNSNRRTSRFDQRSSGQTTRPNVGNLSRQQQQMNAANRRQSSKTALCRNMSNFNECIYGERCYFAHTADELKPKPANIKYKTIPCTAFTQRGECPYGDKCHFLHVGEDAIPVPPDPQRL